MTAYEGKNNMVDMDRQEMQKAIFVTLDKDLLAERVLVHAES